jgi:uncharacterized membrane protein YgcG
MGIPLLFAAIILFIAAYQNQLPYLATNLEQDFAGFFPWLLAVLVIAAIGLIPRAKPVAYALLGLVFLVMLIANKGFFSNLQNIKLTNPPAAPAAPGSAAQVPAASPGVVISGNVGSGGFTGAGVSTAVGAGSSGSSGSSTSATGGAATTSGTGGLL